MAENPIEGFFSGMAAGSTVRRERQMLLQRANQGKISQDEVPGRAHTLMQAFGRAMMTPNERANQDQIKM